MMAKVEMIEILFFIYRFTEDHKHSPTIREIGDALGLRSSSSAHGQVQKVKKAGYVENGNLPRTLVLTDSGIRYLRCNRPEVFS